MFQKMIRFFVTKTGWPPVGFTLVATLIGISDLLLGLNDLVYIVGKKLKTKILQMENLP